MSRTWRVVMALALMSLVLSAPEAAQNEAALRAYFEGKAVTLLVDMPGTNDGVDVAADRRMDARDYGERLKRFGAALRAGDRPVITLVKVKKDLIEFQLAGGGYGTFGDDTSTSVDIPFVEKSDYEKDLEKQLKDEKDAAKKRAIERDLQNLRQYRERENRRITAEREMIADYKQRLLALRRQQGGSRFNIRYAKAVPAGVSPEDVMAALKDVVDFSTLGLPGAVPPREPLAPVDPQPRRGMLRQEAERVFGPPVETSQRTEGTLTVVTLVFVRGSDRITAELVEDVIIRFVIRRPQSAAAHARAPSPARHRP
jgi:hypothetical protein